MTPFAVTLSLVALLGGWPVQAGLAGARVTGRVLDAVTSEPLAGARVSLVPVASRGRVVFPGPAALVETNDQGIYVLEGIAPGRYTVQAQKTGYVPMIGTAGTAAAMLDVNGAAAVAPDVRLERGGVISGQVFDQRGQPLSDVTVSVAQRITARGAVSARPIAASTAQTNDLGEFRVAGLAAGEYLVVANPLRRPSFMSPAAASATVAIPTYHPGFADAAAAQPVRVDAGGTTAGIDIIMLTAPAFGIAGLVADEAGAPVAGAMVTVTAEGTPLGLVGTTRTQADGTFRVPNVPSGSYRLTASVPIVLAPGAGVASGFVVEGGVAGPVPQRPGMAQVLVNGADVTDVRLVVRRP